MMEQMMGEAGPRQKRRAEEYCGYSSPHIIMQGEKEVIKCGRRKKFRSSPVEEGLRELQKGDGECARIDRRISKL